MPNIVGGCLCGSVRYESEAEPVLTAGCHCRHCQKQTSSAFSIFVVLPKGSLRIEGEPLGAFEDVGQSGLPVYRKFLSQVRLGHRQRGSCDAGSGVAQRGNVGRPVVV
jgi:hypothetical protein